MAKSSDNLGESNATLSWQEQLGLTCSSIAQKQLMLSEAKVKFDSEAENAKKDVFCATKKLINFAISARDSLYQRIDDISSRRRLEMEDMSAGLANIQPQLMHLFTTLTIAKNVYADGESSKIDESQEETRKEVLRKISQIQSLGDSIFSGYAWEKDSLTELRAHWTEHIGAILNSLQPLHHHMRIVNYITPDELILEVINFALPENRLDIGINSTSKNISNALLPELNVIIHTFKNISGKAESKSLDESFFGKTSVKELKNQGKVTTVNDQTIHIACPIDLSILRGQFVSVAVNISGIPIRNSPLQFPIQSDEKDKTAIVEQTRLNSGEEIQGLGSLWMNVGPRQDVINITRTGKRINDLDDSDLKAMGYLYSNETLTNDPRRLKDLPPRLSPLKECSNEHIGTYRHDDGSPLAKIRTEQIPRTANQLPLNQPSPMAPLKRPVNINNQVAAASPTRKNFVPPVMSTETNIHKKIEELGLKGILNAADEIEYEPNTSAVLEGDAEGVNAISRFQEDLIAGIQSTNNLDRPEQNAGGKLGIEGHSKNVSFHQNTTIFEQMGDSKLPGVDKAFNNKSMVKHGDTLPYQPGSIDSNTMPYQPGTIDDATQYPTVEELDTQWSIKVGQTKTADGEQALCKSRMQLAKDQIDDSKNMDTNHATFVSNGTINTSNSTSVATMESYPSDRSFQMAEEWNYSKDAFKKHLEAVEKETRNKDIFANGDSPMWDEEKEGNQWEDKRPKKKPEFDLMSPQYQLSLVKTMTLGKEFSTGVPQSVTRDPLIDRTYISDVEYNHIYQYNGWEFEGIWAPEATFIYPRYILCIPDHKHKNRHGMNVVVLDQVALHYFQSNGALKCKLYEGQGCRFRGLAYHKEHGHLITTEKIEGEGVYLVFFDLNQDRNIVKKVLLEPTTLSHHHLSQTKCRFLCYNDGRIITTDMGLGCYYITDLNKNTTEAVYSNTNPIGLNGINRLKEATGVFTDPAGNVIVATCPENDEFGDRVEMDINRGKLQLFSPNGVFNFTLANVEVGRPAGVCLDGRNLYVADVGTKVVEIYTIKESSPMKTRRGSISSSIKNNF